MMHTVTCSLGCLHPACEVCGSADPTAGIHDGEWPLPEMTTCLSCRRAVYTRTDTAAKVRLLIGLEQRPLFEIGTDSRHSATDETLTMPVVSM